MGNYKLYLEKNKAAWEKAINKNYCNLEKCEVKIIPNGVILPLKKKQVARNASVNQLFMGGVQDREGKFVAGLIRKKGVEGTLNYECLDTYKVSEDIEYEDIDVIYGGVYINIFGHVLTENISRLWFMREEKAKIIFLKTDNNPIPEYFYNLLSFLDISKEQIVFLDEIKQYKNVIVPEQAMVLFSGFHPVVNNIYDSIVNYVEKNTEIVHQKIYLSRTKYEPKDCINEEYFERIYEEKGFVIIHPEQESLEKQIALVRGATHIVCTAGTLSHMVLFARKGIKVTILLRENEVGAVSPQLLINQMKEVECEIIDVSLNFLPTTHARGTFLLGPSQGWEKYAKEVFGEVKENEIDIELKKNSYIMKKETFNIYISWIKPLIEEIEKRLENKDLLDKLIERLFTLYFLHNKEKYVEAFWVSE